MFVGRLACWTESQAGSHSRSISSSSADVRLVAKLKLVFLCRLGKRRKRGTRRCKTLPLILLVLVLGGRTASSSIIREMHMQYGFVV